MYAIVAVDERWGIGRDNRLLFHLPADLKHFKTLTSGHTVLMGRKTLQSLPGGRGLPGRRNLVLTSERAFTAENAQVVHSVEDAVRAAGEDAWVIGGESVYRQLLPLCRRVFVTRIAADGGKAVEEFKEKEPDLVLLDVMLPVLDGWGVCAKIRETSKCPIIMLTAKGEVNDRIHGLEMGADDYVVKPFEMKELLARINAVLRRSEIPDDTKKKLVFDKLVINLDSYELLVDGKKVDTPPKELELLYHLAATPNRVYTRNQLLDEVWGFDYFGDSRTVDVHIKRLREKIENVSDQWELKTVWGVGYKFEVK